MLRRSRLTILLVCWLGAMPVKVSAQSFESDLTPESAALVKDADHYVLPDIGDKTLAAAKAADEHDRQMVKFGLALPPADYTSVSRDANNQLRFRGQPASHVSDYYVDTGNIAGDHAWNTVLEAFWSYGAYSLLAEYAT